MSLFVVQPLAAIPKSITAAKRIAIFFMFFLSFLLFIFA
jgi:hypothetical protein